jgi:hypothetical protein
LIDIKKLLNELTTKFPDYSFGVKPTEHGFDLSIDNEVFSQYIVAPSNDWAEAIKQEIDRQVFFNILRQAGLIIKKIEDNTIIPQLHSCLCGRTPQMGGGHEQDMNVSIPTHFVHCSCGLRGKEYTEGYDETDGKKAIVKAAEWWNALYERKEKEIDYDKLLDEAIAESNKDVKKS